MRVEIQVLNRDEEVIRSLTVPASKILDGEVQIDATADVTRSLNLTLHDPNHRLHFDAESPADGALFADRFIRVYYQVPLPTLESTAGEGGTPGTSDTLVVGHAEAFTTDDTIVVPVTSDVPVGTTLVAFAGTWPNYTESDPAPAASFTDSQGNVWQTVPLTNTTADDSDTSYFPRAFTIPDWRYTVVTNPLFVGDAITALHAVATEYRSAVVVAFGGTLSNPQDNTTFGGRNDDIAASNCCRAQDDDNNANYIPEFTLDGGGGIVLAVNIVWGDAGTFTPSTPGWEVLYQTHAADGSLAILWRNVPEGGYIQEEPGGCWSSGAGLYKEGVASGFDGAVAGATGVSGTPGFTGGDWWP